MKPVCHIKRPSQKMIDEYRSFSKDGKIWSSLVTQNKPINSPTASRALKAMSNMGYLKSVGRLKGTRSNSPPHIYEWVH